MWLDICVDTRALYAAGSGFLHIYIVCLISTFDICREIGGDLGRTYQLMNVCCCLCWASGGSAETFQAFCSQLNIFIQQMICEDTGTGIKVALPLPYTGFMQRMSLRSSVQTRNGAKLERMWNNALAHNGHMTPNDSSTAGCVDNQTYSRVSEANLMPSQASVLPNGTQTFCAI